MLCRWLLVDFSGIVVAVNASVVPPLRVVQSGMSKPEVLAHVGPPESISLIYPRTPHDRSYRVRAMLIKNRRVVEKSAEFYVD